ncbi:CRR6 family NdhI maturation factor [Aerosakkonemataceae cyanobacterium BLCC-F50]|uniref:CRR6 family NdhI maturation factor n=1 Tax=Floridaenema flaviceps BLCC-F50 TaxID=3153642 RepID=A0ABV4XVB5_9CYAN
MPIAITINTDQINKLDLSPAKRAIEEILQTGAIATSEQQLSFQINYDRPDDDPRELSEIDEVRLWFIRLDTLYPWLPFLLNWQNGELARYTAMLVPHEFHPRSHEIQYNPQALELFIVQKIFVLTDWLNSQGIPSKSKLKAMALTFGIEMDDAFFDLISTNPV